MWKTAFKKSEGVWYAWNRQYPLKFFKGCRPQILLGLFLNTFFYLKIRITKFVRSATDTTQYHASHISWDAEVYYNEWSSRMLVHFSVAISLQINQQQPLFTVTLPVKIRELFYIQNDVPVTFGLFTESDHCENMCKFGSDRCWFKTNFFLRLSISKNYNSYVVSNVTLSFNLANILMKAVSSISMSLLFLYSLWIYCSNIVYCILHIYITIMKTMCTHPVITTMALWQLIHLGTWYTVTNCWYQRTYGEGTMFLWLHIYNTHLASVSRRSLMISYIYIVFNIHCLFQLYV